MGKLGKKMVDRIRAMLAEGYSKTETANELGLTRKTVASYAIDTEPSPVPEDSGKIGSLDDGSIKFLYDLQGVLGASSVADAIEQAYRAAVSIAKLKVTHWKLYSSDDEIFTADAMVQYLLNHDEHQTATLNKTQTELRDAENEILKLMDDADNKYDEGFEKGREDYAIYAQCAYCGKPYQVVPLSEAHGLVKQTLLKNGWGHESCVNQP